MYDITNEHFKRITKEALEEGKKPATVNRITATLSTLFRELKTEQGLILETPAFKRQKESQGRPGYYTEEEVQRILKCAAEESDYFLLYDSILFSVKTGCRQCELLSLTVNDIDLDSKDMVFIDTKNGTDHWLKIHDDVLPTLKRRLEYRDSELLFPWDRGSSLLDAFKRTMKRAGFDDADPRVWHTLRHSVATWLCEKGVPLRSVMGVLNHKNVSTTLRYAKASNRAVADAIDML